MAAIFCDLADAITTELAARLADSSFGAAYAAIVPDRSYADWEDTLESMGTLQVDVVPVEHEIAELETHGSVKYQIPVDIGIRQRFGRGDNGRVAKASVDALVLLLENIFEHFAALELSGMSSHDCNWFETKIRQTFNREHLREHGQYTGIIRTTYRISKEETL